jgi:hypothetical protein
MGCAEQCWSRVLLGCMFELAKEQSCTVAYQATISLGRRDEGTAHALTCLGHYHHVRGDIAKATSYYDRALMYAPSNPHALSLYAPLLASAQCLEKDTSNHIAQRRPGASTRHHIRCDAMYRKAIASTQQLGEVQWMLLVAYGEFLSSTLQVHQLQCVNTLTAGTGHCLGRGGLHICCPESSWAAVGSDCSCSVLRVRCARPCG